MATGVLGRPAPSSSAFALSVSLAWADLQPAWRRRNLLARDYCGGGVSRGS